MLFQLELVYHLSLLSPAWGDEHTLTPFVSPASAHLKLTLRVWWGTMPNMAWCTARGAHHRDMEHSSLHRMYA